MIGSSSQDYATKPKRSSARVRNYRGLCSNFRTFLSRSGPGIRSNFGLGEELGSAELCGPWPTRRCPFSRPGSCPPAPSDTPLLSLADSETPFQSEVPVGRAPARRHHQTRPSSPWPTRRRPFSQRCQSAGLRPAGAMRSPPGPGLGDALQVKTLSTQARPRAQQPQRASPA